MTPDIETLPVVGRAYRLGVNPITTTLVLCGPVVLALVAVLGRSPLTVGLALLYVLAMPGSVAYFRLVGADGLEREDGGDG